MFSFSLIDGQAPSELGKLSNLRMLQLDHTRMSGQIPLSLSALQKLEYVCMSFSFFSGMHRDCVYVTCFQVCCPIFLCRKSSITCAKLAKCTVRVAMHNHRLTCASSGPLPASLGLKPLQWLGIHSCALSGGLPDTFVNLKDSICSIELVGNQLSGSCSHVPTLLTEFVLQVRFNPRSSRCSRHLSVIV